jgi:hypothetical protein
MGQISHAQLTENGNLTQPNMELSKFFNRNNLSASRIFNPSDLVAEETELRE